ncbi:MAG TPA: SH3 domain-containing protein [Polyangia bacterium]|nr:SH3 domain-containing protein [Polyangia bacterium]
MALVAWSGSAGAGDGVVTAPESIVRTAPFEVAPEVMRLHAGDKVPADNKPIGAWRRVQLADGRVGVVRDADIQVTVSATSVAETPAQAPPPAPVAVVSPAAAPPQASDFGAAEGLVLSTERLFGYVHVSATSTIAGVNQTENASSFSFVTNPLGSGTILSAPRLAADFFAPHHISVGGSVGYFRLSEKPAGAPSDVKFSGFLIAPRLGYAALLAPKVVMWPRIGFTFTRISVENSGQTVSETTAYALTVEVPLVFIVAPHVFLSLAPTLDVGLGGSVSSSNMSTSRDQTITSFGLQAAFGAFF